MMPFRSACVSSRCLRVPLLRIFGNTVWAATNHGAYTHSVTNLSGPWKLQFAPNPDFLPGGAQAADPPPHVTSELRQRASRPRQAPCRTWPSQRREHGPHAAADADSMQT